MKKMLIILITAVVFLTTADPAEPAVLEVIPPGSVGAFDVFTSIQAAIDDANDGDTILIHTGTYTEQLSIAGKGLTLTGVSEAGVIIEADTVQTAAGNTITIDAAGKTVTISNLTIRHGNYGLRSTAGNVNVLSCTIYHNGWDGTPYPEPPTQAGAAAMWASSSTSNGGAIRIQDSASTEIADCTVYENARGIRCQDTANADIHGNVAHDNIESGIYLSASSYDGTTGCTDANVHGNQSYNNMNNGILCIGGINNIIIDNDIHDNWNSGITLWHVADTIVEDNTLNNNNLYSFNGVGNPGDAYGGIYAEGSTIDAGATFAFKILGNSIADSQAGAAAQAIGLRLDETLPPDGIEITGNTFTNHDVDIHVRSQAATTSVKENCFDGPAIAVGIQNDDTAELDATLNAWGDASGPYHAIKNAAGTGHSVSDDVDIYPWYIDCTMTTVADLPVHNVTQDLYYNTIQDGIDAANPSDELTVAPGTFVEQLEITIPLTITGSGEGSTIIQSPDTLTLFFATSNNNYPIVYLHDVSGVVIEELTVDGAGKGNANYRFQGIGLRNAGATIQNVTVINVMDTPFSGAQHGVALYVYNTDGTDRNVNVLGCTFTDYQKNAMAINGANAIGHVENCTTIGAGDTTVTAQNGIQFWAATGTIKNNVVKDMRYTGPSWSASGILGYGASGPESITIEDNIVENCQGAIQVYYYNGDVNVADNNCAGNDFSYLYAFDTGSVTGNNFNSCGEGLYLADVTNISLAENTFNDCNTGMVVDGASDTITATDCEFNDGNTGILVVPYEPDHPDNVSIECSQISGNAVIGIQNDSNNLVDADDNWWGDGSGPSGAGGGTGDGVSANVDFFPWLLSEDCEDATVVVADYVVDDDWVGLPDWTTVMVEGTAYFIGLNAFDTIQGAIDAASDGNSITVADGNYPENPVIYKSLEITGAGGETSTIESATGTVLVSINTAGKEVEFSGFTLKHTGIDNWGSSYALLVNNGAYANIHDNVVADFKKRGIYVEGTDSSADIKDNIVIGEGENGLQNGIVAWNSAGGFVNIIGNEVSGGTYTGEDWSGSGIMALDTWDKVILIAENYVFENEVGIAAGDYCEYNAGSYTANVTIQGNTLVDNEYGVEIFNDIRGAHVIGNVITGCTEYAVGVYDYTSSGWSDCLPPTDTVIQYNSIADNNEGLWVEDPVGVVNAKYNFWGHASGPQDPNGTEETDGTACPDVEVIKNADGQGDSVSEENAEYCPWLAVPIISSTSPCPVGDLDGDCDNDFLDFARFAANWLEGTEP